MGLSHREKQGKKGQIFNEGTDNEYQGKQLFCRRCEVTRF